MFFEVLKLRIRGVTIPYCANVKKLNEKEKSIETEIQRLETLVVNNSEKKNRGHTGSEGRIKNHKRDYFEGEYVKGKGTKVY